MGNYFDKYDEAPDVAPPVAAAPVAGAAPDAAAPNHFDKYDEPAAPVQAAAAPGEPKADVPGTWSDIGKQALLAVPRAGLGMVDALTATPMFRAANNLRRIAGKEELPTFRPAVESVLPEKANPDAPANLPKNRGERAVDMVVQGAVGGLGPGGLGVKAGQMLKGAFSGLTADVAQEVVPEKYKGIAGLVGGVAGGLAGEAPQLAWKAAGKGAGLVPVTAGQIDRAAAGQILEASSDPSALRAAVAAGKKEIVPGSEPTTFQQTGDMGLGALERARATENPELFKAREAAQNIARVKAIPSQNLGAADDFSKLVRDQMDQTNLAQEAAIASARRLAQAEAAGLGPEKTGEAIGASIRTPAQKALDARNTAEQAMWRAVPTDVHAVTSPIKAAIGKVYGDMNPTKAATLAGPEKELIDLVGGYGEHIPFTQLSDLRTVINDAMMTANMTGKTGAAGRLKPVRGSIEAAINETLKLRAAEDEAAAAVGKMAPEDTLSAKLKAAREQFARDQGRGKAPEGAAATGTGDASGVPPVARGEGAVGTGLRDPSGNIRVSPGVEGGGQRVGGPGVGDGSPPVNRVHYPGGSFETRPEIVERSDLRTSHDADFRENPDYPQELQPRDRSSAVARDQVNLMASRLEPARLHPSPDVNNGAPVVGPDNVVESGNGRTLALGQVYAKGRGDAYKASLTAAGHDISGFHEPVLVSRRVSPMTPEQREFMAQSANASTGLRMSAPEQAVADAKFLTDDVIGKAADKPITHADNREFVKYLVAKLPAAERGAILDKDGNLSQGGVRRIEAAIVSRAYGDGSLVQRAFESTDHNIKNLAGALVDSAIPWAKMRDAARAGTIDAEHDVTSGLLADVHAIMKARDAGVPVAEVINQRSLFGGDIADDVHGLIFKDPKTGAMFSRARIAANLEAHAAESLKNEAGPSLFGDTVSARDVMKAAIAKAGRETGPEVEAAALPPAEEAAPKPAAAAQEVPGSGGATFATGAKEKPPGPKLVTQEGADAIRAATAAHKEKKTLFGVPELKGILKRKFETSPYEVDDGGVAKRFWRPGPEGSISIKRLMAATKNAPEAIAGLRDAAIHSVQGLMKDGVLPDAAFQTWRRQHGEALRRLESLAPGTLARFESAAAATRAVETATAARAVAMKEFETGALAKLIKADHADEVKRAVGTILESATGPTEMAKLAARVQGNAPAQAGLRRAVVDHVTQKLTSATEVGTSGVKGLNSAQFQKYVAAHDAALRAVLSPEEMDSLHAIAADLMRANRSVSAVKLKGGSNTAQDLHAMGKHGGQQSAFHALVSGVSGHMLGAIGTGGAGLAVAGVPGFLAGAVLAPVIGALRARGVARINDLVTDAVLNPDVMKALFARVPENKGAALTMRNRLLRASLRGGLIGTLAGNQDQSDKRASQR